MSTNWSTTGANNFSIILLTLNLILSKSYAQLFDNNTITSESSKSKNKQYPSCSNVMFKTINILELNLFVIIKYCISVVVNVKINKTIAIHIIIKVAIIVLATITV